jgi:hypothetical protein
MTDEDQNVLLSLCESGLVKETKFGRFRHIELPDTRVFAAANRIDRFRPEVLSRFEVLRFPEYTRQGFVEVVEEILHQREGLPRKISSKIGETLWGVGSTVTGQILSGGEVNLLDPREAIRIARLMTEPTEADLKEVLSLLNEYR